MASLSQALRGQSQLTRGPGGALQEDKTAQQKANQLGLAAAPTTPGGAAMIGANPDQAKMAGTPAQLSAALNKSAAAVQPQNTLQTALRQQQSRTQTTGQEQQKLQKSADMQALGGLGDRVTNFIDTQRQLIASQQPVQLQANQPQIDLAPDKQAKLQAALAKLITNPQDQQALIEANQALDKDINNMLTADQIRQMYKSDIDTIGQTATGAVANNMTVSNLFSDPQFGYDANSLSQLLGVPEAELSNYTVDQLQEKINQVTTQEFNQSAQLEQEAYNPLAGQAERQLSQQAGREASTTGIRATEADTARLNESIQKGDVVSFGGKTMQLADALDDENISGLIKEYIEGDENFKKQLEQSEPQLAKFIKDNQAVLAEATAQIEKGTTAFAETQTYNQGLAKVGNLQLDKSVMESIVPNWGKLSASRVDTTKIPVLSYTKDLSPEAQEAFGNALNTAVVSKLVDPREFAGLSVDQIKKLQPGVPGSNWDNYLQAKETTARIQSLPAGDDNAALAEMYEGNPSIDQINQMVTEGKSLSALGLGKPTDISAIDTNGDGLPDTGNITNIAKSKVKNISLSDAAEGDKSAGKLKLEAPQPPAPGSMDYNLYQKLQAGAQDGHISSADIQAADMSLDELIALEGKVGQKGTNIDPAVGYIRQQAASANTRQLLDQAKSTSGDIIQNVLNIFKSDKSGKKLDKAMLANTASNAINSHPLTATLKQALAAPGGSLISNNNIAQVLGWIDSIKDLGLASNDMLKLANDIRSNYGKLNGTQVREPKRRSGK